MAIASGNTAKNFLESKIAQMKQEGDAVAKHAFEVMLIDIDRLLQMASSAIDEENLKAVNYIMETEDEVKVDEPMPVE